MAPLDLSGTHDRPIGLTVAAALLAGILMAGVMHLLTPEREIDSAEDQKLHQEAVARHLAKRAEATLDTSPIYDPGTVVTPRGVAPPNARTVEDEVIRAVPDEKEIFAALAKRARPYRADMLNRLRAEADRPVVDDSDQRLTHEEIDEIDYNDLFIQ